jgi:hypothetical protein
MRTCLVATVLAAGTLAVSSSGAEPLQSSYKVGQEVPILWEYRVTGPRAGQEGSFKCSYAQQPAVVLYCRDINTPVIQLIKKIDEATAQHSTQPPERYRERLRSYVVLFCDSKDRESELKDLAEKEKIRHTILALIVVKNGSDPPVKLGDAETTVFLTGPRHLIKASYAYRKGELKDKDIEQILADLPKILPKKD